MTPQTDIVLYEDKTEVIDSYEIIGEMPPAWLEDGMRLIDEAITEINPNGYRTKAAREKQDAVLRAYADYEDIDALIERISKQRSKLLAFWANFDKAISRLNVYLQHDTNLPRADTLKIIPKHRY